MLTTNDADILILNDRAHYRMEKGHVL